MKDSELSQQKGETNIQYFERLMMSGIKSIEVSKIMLQVSYKELRMCEEQLENARAKVELYEDILKREGYIPPQKTREEPRHA